MKKILSQKQKGSFLIQAFIFGTISIIMIGALVSWASVNIKASKLSFQREQSLQIAEAGIEYYRWHLAHAPTDFRDGTNEEGPYTHDFFDKNGNKIGEFQLNITPPEDGFTIVTIRSTGRLDENPSAYRSIEVRLAIPSLAKYAVVANDFMRFGEGTEVYGPIHSNSGIRFDGIAYNIVSSSRETFDDPDHTGSEEFGVHTHVNPPPQIGVNENFRPSEAPPNLVQNRYDVFRAGRMFPVPVIDFSGLTTDISQMKSASQTGGRYISSSGALGYRIVLKTNNTFDLYRVTAMETVPSACVYSETGWSPWSIRSNGQTFISNYSMPNNGIIFVEDNVWVEGQVQGKRITIAAGRFPDNINNRPAIIVNNNLLYSYYDSRDVIALISQGNINVGLRSINNLRIDAALIAQNGRVGRHYYSSSCGTGYVRDSITLFGMIASNGRYGFAYTNGTGYTNREIVYDANLLYGPPPNFPLTSDQYEIISWEEVR